MDGLTLLEHARAAGLTVRADGDRLVVRGPKRADALARRLLANKAGVLATLGAADTSAATPARPSNGPADPPGWPVGSAGWGDDAREVYVERLAIGDEQGMDTSPGSEG